MLIMLEAMNMQGEVSETSVHATQFDCEPKTALKDQVYYIYSPKEKSVSECMLIIMCYINKLIINF